MDEEQRVIVLVVGDASGWTVITPDGTLDPAPMPARWAATQLRRLLPFLADAEDD